MTSQGTAISDQSVFSDRRLSLNLILTESGDVDIRSCEVVGKCFRNRTSFPDYHTLDSVVVNKLADAMKQTLRDLPAGPQVVSLPEFLVELPGLVLSGAHLLVTKVQNGIRSAIFRFRDFLGSVSNMFRDSIGFEGSYADDNAQLATQVLTDICLPILNLCNQMEHMLQETPIPVGIDLRARSSELEFQTELLKRFVMHSAHDAPEAPMNYLTRGTHASAVLPPR
jgi:hypothetical protein